ncbi:lantibiotic dehydratase [Amycolatopsis sp. NPDC059021]|uniref:lantibiotic dehydratase n=1 Tax=Amycolatopsis sp. NPDC059021 TaxID=3346704 RepID=UPI0036724C30
MPDSLFRAWDVFLVRAPLAAGRAALPARGDRLALLRAAAADPLLSEAIALATPSLSRLLDRVAAGRVEGLKASQLRRAALAVLRYDIRMRTRPTPFGVFSGVACGRFDTSAKTRRGEAHRTRTHVDMQWLLGVVHELETDGELLRSLSVRAHPALAIRGDRVVLDCPSSLGAPPGGTARATVSVRNSPVVSAVLEEAAETISFDTLAERVGARFAVPAERVAGMLSILVGEELLITGLRPPLDGGDPLRHVIEILGAASLSGKSADTLAALHEIGEGRTRYDTLPIGEGRDELARTIDIAHRLNDYATPLHVDTALDVETRLPYEVRAEVEQAVELMWRMSRDKLGLFALRGYHARFLERYGADRVVPILELLDEAHGLGAPAGYGWPAAETAAEDPQSTSDSERVRLIHRLVAGAVRSGQREVELTDELVATFTTGSDPATAPNSCEVTVHLVAASPDALSSGDFRIVLSPSPGSHQAGATFARFADLLPGDALGEEITRLPCHVEDAIRADLAFLPRSGKAANLAHTVPHSGRRISVGLPDAPGTDEIRLSDIGIGATLERLCAVHLPTGREIVPSLGNMVSPTAQAPNAARLLWEIGLEGQRLWEPWNWGPLADAPYVPRIRRGRFVLAPAVWRLDSLRDADDFPAAVADWRREWDVPEQVLVVSNDQRLLLDLTDPWHLELLRDEIRKDATLVAQEVPGAGADGIGGHITELVVPLSRRDTTPTRRRHVAYADPARENAGLGGDWLYLKLYGPSRGQDDLLREQLPALVEQARGHGTDRWFFIRYTDPEGHHLRVRFHGEPSALWGDVARAVGGTLTEWQRHGLIRTHRVDQYDPEAERYGGVAALAAAERVFEADSEAAIRLLELTEHPDCPYSLDTLAAVSVASLADAFDVPVPGTPRVPADCGDDAAAAWLSMTGVRRALPELYRKDAARWRRIVDPYGGWSQLAEDPYGKAALDALSTRDEPVRRLRSEVEGSRTPHGRLIGSLMHMTCNRLFGGDTDREVAVVAIARGAVQDNLNRRRHVG